MTFVRRVAILFAVLVVVTTSACNIGAIFPPAHLDFISLDGDSTVAVGDTIRLIARGSRGTFASTPDPLWDAEWTSTDSRIATVSIPPRDRADTLAAPILVRGVGRGRVQILVYARGVSAMHIVDVY
jgi:hypothetical protein